MDDSLAVLVLPSRLEDFEREAHARSLLSIPRVVALEPSRLRTPRFMREATCMRQARRLRFPGRLRLAVLYHPAQYPLARALCARYEQLELWYLPPGEDALPGAGDPDAEELSEFDRLARDHARATLPVSAEGAVDDEPLRARLRELEVINPRAFVPGGRLWRR